MLLSEWLTEEFKTTSMHKNILQRVKNQCFESCVIMFIWGDQKDEESEKLLTNKQER